jgi:predicted DNA-binding transcriptional regulator AlpA
VSSSIPQPIEDSSGRDAPDLVRTGQPESAALSKVLNLAEAASLVRCSRAHLSNIINGKVRGIPHLPTVRIGRRVLFRRESLELWLQRVEAASPARTPQ